MIRGISTILFCFVVACVSAQLGMRHMHYNLTLYGNPFGCENFQNDPALKDIHMDIITDYVMPDIITVNEMRDGDFWADRLLNEALNTEGDEFWARAELSDVLAGQSIVNACYYRSDRWVLASQDAVYFALDNTLLLRHVDFYTFYPLSQNSAADTTFFTVIVAHLAASEAAEREDQTEAVMARIAEMGPGNYIFTGDLNIDEADENAFANLVDGTPSLAFVDPIDVSDVWNNNPAVSEYHTQSTRDNSDTNSGCFVGGGMDDRFDITLVSPSIWFDLEGMSYVIHSYDALGNDGGDFNDRLTVNGNTEVPSSVASALFEMSDHLPIITEYTFDDITSLTNLTASNDIRYWIAHGRLYSDATGVWSFLELYDVSGRLLHSWQDINLSVGLDLPELASPIIFLRGVSTAEGATTFRLATEN